MNSLKKLMQCEYLNSDSHFLCPCCEPSQPEAQVGRYSYLFCLPCSGEIEALFHCNGLMVPSGGLGRAGDEGSTHKLDNVICTAVIEVADVLYCA